MSASVRAIPMARYCEVGMSMIRSTDTEARCCGCKKGVEADYRIYWLGLVSFLNGRNSGVLKRGVAISFSTCLAAPAIWI